MKREFLQNFKVGDQPLTKEIIDAIMAENGADIEKTKRAYEDYDNIKEQLTTAKEQLKAFENVDVKELQGQITKLTKDLKDKDTEFAAQLADRDFQDALKVAIGAAKGKEAKAIMPFLDMTALKASKNQADDIKAALENVKKDYEYLFEDDSEPGYPGGTGSGGVGGKARDGVEAEFAKLNPGIKFD